MVDLIPFFHRVRKILKERKITTLQFECDTGIARRILYKTDHRPHKATLMAIAYYLKMDGEELVKGTDVEDIWHG